MTKYSLLTIALGAGLAFAPLSSAAPAPQQREQHARANFHFSPAASTKLREHYRTNFRDHDRSTSLSAPDS